MLFDTLDDPAVIEAGVRAQLADSLDHIQAVVGPDLPDVAGNIQAAATNIRDHRQYPGVMARYFDLVGSVTASDAATARRLSAEMAELSRMTPELATVAFGESALGDDAERFPRLVFAETGGRAIEAPSAETFAEGKPRVDAALAVIARIDHRAFREIEGLCSRIILAGGKRDDGRQSFGGVTSLLAWGAIFLNLDAYRTADSFVDGLVHEVTHATLLGLSAQEPLVRNPPEENYSSPLRDDPRPMDGLYHATIVCGRLAHFHGRWAEDAGDDRTARDARLGQADRARAQFLDGKKTVDQEGDLSDLARAILDECDAAAKEAA